MSELPSTMSNLPTTAPIEPKQSAGDPPTKTIKRKKKVNVDAAQPVAKAKPVVDPPTPAQPAPQPQWTEPQTKKNVVEGSVNLTIPFCLDKKIRPRRRFLTALRDLTAKQRFGLNVLLEGMKVNGTTIENGAVVNSHVNAIRALLEMAADAASGAID